MKLCRNYKMKISYFDNVGDFLFDLFVMILSHTLIAMHISFIHNQNT